jgi:hypothetical protein
MSLISGANFVAPLRSKVQVVGIFALAALVAVLRLVGSGETTHDDRSESSNRRAVVATGGDPSVADEVDAFLASRRKSRSLQGAQGSAGDVTVDQLLQGDGASRPAANRRPSQNAEGNSGEPEKLNDIKRSLGLE